MCFSFSDVHQILNPQYRDKIKTPMDLGTMTLKVRKGKYKSWQDWKQDVQLLVDNCVTFYKPGSNNYKV